MKTIRETIGNENVMKALVIDDVVVVSENYANTVLRLKYGSRYTGYDLEELKLFAGILLEENKYKYKTLYNTTVLDYDPIANVDAHETITDRTTVERSGTGSNTDKGTTTNNLVEESNGKTKEDNTTTETDTRERMTTEENSNLHTVAGGDSNKLEDDNKDTGTHTTTEIIKGGNLVTTENNSTDNTNIVKNTGTVQDDKTSTNEHSETETTEHTIENVRKGNIGVTSTQQLIESERKIAMFSIMEEYVLDYVRAVSFIN